MVRALNVAESEGFEPPEGLTLRLISSQVHSAGLCQLSVRGAHIKDEIGCCKVFTKKYLIFFVRLTKIHAFRINVYLIRSK